MVEAVMLVRHSLGTLGNERFCVHCCFFCTVISPFCFFSFFLAVFHAALDCFAVACRRYIAGLIQFISIVRVYLFSHFAGYTSAKQYAYRTD